jgi:hypothetical protein
MFIEHSSIRKQCTFNETEPNMSPPTFRLTRCYRTLQGCDGLYTVNMKTEGMPVTSLVGLRLTHTLHFQVKLARNKLHPLKAVWEIIEII